MGMPVYCKWIGTGSVGRENGPSQSMSELQLNTPGRGRVVSGDLNSQLDGLMAFDRISIYFCRGKKITMPPRHFPTPPSSHSYNFEFLKYLLRKTYCVSIHFNDLDAGIHYVRWNLEWRWEGSRFKFDFLWSGWTEEGGSDTGLKDPDTLELRFDNLDIPLLSRDGNDWVNSHLNISLAWNQMP